MKCLSEKLFCLLSTIVLILFHCSWSIIGLNNALTFTVRRVCIHYVWSHSNQGAQQVNCSLAIKYHFVEPALVCELTNKNITMKISFSELCDSSPAQSTSTRGKLNLVLCSFSTSSRSYNENYGSTSRMIPFFSKNRLHTSGQASLSSNTWL